MTDSAGSENKLPPPLPAAFPGQFASCKARASGFVVNDTLCLIKPPLPCPHRQVVGENYFCRHPNQKAIIEQTTKVIPFQEGAAGGPQPPRIFPV